MILGGSLAAIKFGPLVIPQAMNRVRKMFLFQNTPREEKNDGR